MAQTFFLKGIEQMMLGQINLESDSIKLIYMSTSYTPDLTNHNWLSDVLASIASGSPTETLTGKDVRIDTVNGRVEFDADDVSESPVTCSTNKFILYKATGVDATSPLIVCQDITEGTLSPVGGQLAITFNTEGLFAINPS